MAESTTYRRIERIMVQGGPLSDLLRRTSRAYLPWDEFLTMRLPTEMSPVETWEMLKTVNRTAGIKLPVPDLAGNQYWYLRTHEIADTVCRIQCLCREDSDLHRQLTTTRNRRVLVRSRIAETVAAALLDGLNISEEQGYALLQSDRAPHNNTERVMVNTLTTMDLVTDMVKQPFSPELMFRLRDLLLQGLSVSSLETTPRRMGLMTSEYSDEEVQAAAERQLKYICDYANHLTGDPHDHPVLRALFLPDLFRLYRPLPCMNSQVGRVVFRLYALKAGLPVLGMLSLSRTKLSWEDGVLDSATVSAGPKEYSEARLHSGTDLTGYATLVVQMALSALQDLDGQIRSLKEQDEQLRSLLQDDPRLNHRQRSVLGRALRDPGAEFRIASHRTTHSVVYATARTDLLDLVDRGYLDITKRGRAYVFVPRPGMRALVEADEGIVPSSLE
ncbi:MAG: hypothetical protein LLG08_05760 [Actinomycetia bacterium]|nr:hypothetical protein [Actinomycetes bacterium]